MTKEGKQKMLKKQALINTAIILDSALILWFASGICSTDGEDLQTEQIEITQLGHHMEEFETIEVKISSSDQEEVCVFLWFHGKDNWTPRVPEGFEWTGTLRDPRSHYEVVHVWGCVTSPTTLEFTIMKDVREIEYRVGFEDPRQKKRLD